jgi:TPR repeat protein
MLIQGRGDSQNKSEAAIWMKKSAAQGYNAAQAG